jgi:hypothetical protein
METLVQERPDNGGSFEVARRFRTAVPGNAALRCAAVTGTAVQGFDIVTEVQKVSLIKDVTIS